MPSLCLLEARPARPAICLTNAGSTYAGRLRIHIIQISAPRPQTNTHTHSEVAPWHAPLVKFECCVENHSTDVEIQAHADRVGCHKHIVAGALCVK